MHLAKKTNNKNRFGPP